MEQIKGPLSILFIGDTHGNDLFMKSVIEFMSKNRIDLGIQLGDFGFCSSERDGLIRPFSDPVLDYAKIVDDYAADCDVPIWAIRGNHDDPAEASRFSGAMDLVPGLHFVRDSTRVKLGEKIFLFNGGAVSVDRFQRTPDVSWWADEMVSAENVHDAIGQGLCDVWVTHDSVEIPPNKRPLNFGEVINADINIQRERMRTIFRNARPSIHIHGHWHLRYSAPTPYGVVHGLDCENNDSLMLMNINEQGYIVD